MSASAADSVAVVRSYLAAFAGADPDAIAEHVSDDFWNEHVSSLGSSCRGRAEYRRRLPDFLATFQGVEYETEDVVADGERVVVAYRMMASYEGESDIVIRGVFRFEVGQGLITHRVDYFDSLTFLEQTGGA